MLSIQVPGEDEHCYRDELSTQMSGHSHNELTLAVRVSAVRFLALWRKLNAKGKGHWLIGQIWTATGFEVVAWRLQSAELHLELLKPDKENALLKEVRDFLERLWVPSTWHAKWCFQFPTADPTCPNTKASKFPIFSRDSDSERNLPFIAKTLGNLSSTRDMALGSVKTLHQWS